MTSKSEKWKAIPKYEGHYEVSTLGRVRSVTRTIVNIRGRMLGRTRRHKGRILRPSIDCRGRAIVKLWTKNYGISHSISRLMALTFLTNPLCLPVVDNIDQNHSNDHVTNLRWASHSQNLHNQSPRTGRSFKGVDYRPTRNQWRARIRVHPGRFNLGHFPTAEDAAVAYNNAAVKYHGEFAYLNPLPKANT